MGLLDEATRKLHGSDDPPRHLKPERLAGHYEIYEGYDEDAGRRARQLSRTARRSLRSAMNREALTMGAIGLALGLAVGVALTLRNTRR